MRKLLLPCVLIIILASCRSDINQVSRELVIKNYYPQDSLIFDTLYFQDNVLKKYSKQSGLEFVHQLDSIISLGISNDSTYINENLWILSLNRFEINFGQTEIPIIEYLAITKTTSGEWDNYGVYAEYLGTVHFRSYHSKRPFSLLTANSDNTWITPKNANELMAFVEDSILINQSLPALDQEQMEREIEEPIELDIE